MATGMLSTDLVLGDSRNNVLDGGEDDDRLLGFAGNDTLRGNAGRDYIEGGDGDDTLTGGDGPDRFVIDRQDGHDAVTDFIPLDSPCGPDVQCIHAGVPWDRIVLWDGEFFDVRTLVDSVTASPAGDAVLTYGETTLTLAGIPSGSVTEEWFILI